MGLNTTEAAELERAKRILASRTHTVAFPTEAEQKPPTIAEQVSQAVAAFNTDDVDALITQARTRLTLAPSTPVAENKQEAPNAEVVNTLLAKAAELKRTADSAAKARDKITDLLAELTGDAEELTVHGATVFTVKPVESRGLNTSFIKSKFPDIEGNEDYWQTSSSVRRLYK